MTDPARNLKFLIGETVRVTSEQHGHKFKIGSLVQITGKNDTFYTAKDETGESWCICDLELEKACKTELAVDHPAHYNQGKFEVIDVLEDWKCGFNDGNAIKYLSRFRHKGNPVQDVEKAIWYCQRLLRTLMKEKK